MKLVWNGRNLFGDDVAAVRGQDGSVIVVVQSPVEEAVGDPDEEDEECDSEQAALSLDAASARSLAAWIIGSDQSAEAQA